MPRVSVNILTKNRAELLKKALASVLMQSFKDFQIVVVDDGSTDNTEATLQNLKIENLKIVSHRQSSGITKSRQEALEKSEGEYIAILDDDDEWLDKDKLKKQLDYFEQHPKAVLVGGGIKTKNEDFKLKSQSDIQIRQTMLFRNNFYTSTIMFKKSAAMQAGGFIIDGADLAEDYDLWLRLGNLGEMANLNELFAAYRVSDYNKLRYKEFLKKQLALVKREKNNYNGAWLAALILNIRLLG